MIVRQNISAAARQGALALCFITTGCSSTGVGNPGPGPVESLSLAIVADDGDGGTEGDDSAPLPSAQLRKAVMVLAGITWLPCDSTREPLVQPGPFVVDLLAGETTPELPEIELPEAGLCGFDAELGRARDSAELAGRSLFFAGARADGLEFILYADVRATLSLRLEPGDAIGNDEEVEPLRLLWAMRPRRWAREAELGMAQPLVWRGGRRSIVIDADRHPLLLAAIRARLGSESGLFLDRDGDGRLGTDERASVLGTPSSDD